MNTTMKNHEKRTGERRMADRRQANLPLAGKDRRVAQRRSGSERRA
jgi:hypothetical protein